MFTVSVADVSPTHMMARCAPCMCPPNKVLLLTMYLSHVQIHRKSTANPSRQVRCYYLSQLLSLIFDASLPRFRSSLPLHSSLSHPILPSDIPPCPGISRRNHHGHSSLLPTPSLSSVSHAATAVPLATRCCQLPLTNPSITPPPPPSSQLRQPL